MTHREDAPFGEAPKEPMFNLPPVILWLSGVMVVIHSIRAFLLDQVQDVDVMVLFAFLPMRYDPEIAARTIFPGGIAADVWTFVTYGLLHGDFVHLAVNVFWLAAFGSAVAWRFGAVRFLLFCAVTTVFGAFVHLAAHFGEAVPMIGASAAVSGLMAAAARFAFSGQGAIAGGRGNQRRWHRPAPPLLAALSDRRVFVFLAVWFGLNIVVGLNSGSFFGDGTTIAWEAHIGGFLAGLLLFPLFDPVPSNPQGPQGIDLPRP
ncbi:membrane associated rhomboid family serine protease [Rhodobium orientis]|uniref:rhomboid family intramembrane serine protease n=1 Tax=Rhodobium orientis TaxID=34017 RepID=UPI001839B0C0|nr:rhomboid family intramembrane serine protease [Rhodobium orientis]MBB4301697.1 membrane associated rhomboid family serine protease [Rhodobium orientis]